MSQNEDIFSGLEDLGFEDLTNVDIYEDKEKKNEKEKEKENQGIKQAESEEVYLYDKKVTCPVCKDEFFARAVRTSGYRMKGRDSDFYIKYDFINPYFYDVLLCDSCGYAAMKSDFEKLRKNHIELIQKNISPKWQSRKYPSVHNVDIAIERYKLSLLNYTVMSSKSSKKAMNCLKLAWMYRVSKNSSNEILFMKQALIGFKDVYFNEDLPVYGMNKFAIMYLIGELNRRLGNYEEALRYFGEVIISQAADKKIKNLARDQKDLIKENLPSKSEPIVEEPIENKKKTSLLSRFFK